ncbi:thioredoxin domain-containing protein [Buchananella felis]|uniref:thioredoxin domain-containing protein n=1 Tax=Buchananella felis TaxID=3231492 RepID=UPI003527629D
MKKTLIPLALIASIALAGCSTDKPSDSMSPAMTDDKMMTAEPTDAMTPDGAMSMEPTDAMSPDSAMTGDHMAPSDAMSHSTSMSGSMTNGAMASASYVTYADYKAAKEKFAGNKIVLFFNASWCPACRSITEAISADPSLVPAGTTLVSVDYDQHTDLRQQYGVTMQHTFVELDAKEMQVRQWASTSVDDLLKELKG